MNLKSFCDNWLAAWTGNQPEKLLEFYHTEAFYSDPAKPNGIKGHPALLTYFQRLLAWSPQWIWRALELYPTEKGFILKWEAQIPKGNEILLKTGMDIVELKESKIIRNEVYFDARGIE